MTITYRKEKLIGFCYMCGAAHSADEVLRTLEGGKTHCPCCKQKLPDDQRLSAQVVWVCKRTGVELFDDHLFKPPLEVEAPIEHEEPVEEESIEVAGPHVRAFKHKKGAEA